MPKNAPFPSKEADLNNYFILVVAYLLVAANKARLLVSAANEAKLIAQLATWNSTYALTANVNTRTKTATDNKDIAKADLMTTLRNVYADIPNSALTTADRNILNLPERSTTKTPAPVPTTKPIAQVDTSNRLVHEVSFTDEDGSAAKPTGVHGCQIWMKIGTAAIDPDELKYVGTATASPFEVKFKGEDAGKNVYYWLRWENTRGETGPWSDAVMATVTG
jgi:hypothetical protein